MTENRQRTVGGAQDNEQNTLQRRLLLVPFCIAVFSLSALFYYHLRQDYIDVRSPLQVGYSALYRTFGFAPSLMFFLLLLIWTSIWFFSGTIERPWGRLLRLFATTVMLGVFLNVRESGVIVDSPQQGELGAYFATRLVAAFGYYPSLILVLIATLGALLLATDFLFSETFERLWARSARADAAAAAPDLGVEADVTDQLKQLGAVGAAIEPRAGKSLDPGARAAPAATTASAASAGEADEAIVAEVHDFGEFEAEVEPPIQDPTPEVDLAAADRRFRRRSYFERRSTVEAEGSTAAQPTEQPAAASVPPPVEPVEPPVEPVEAWVPSSPDDEIDNPETAAVEAELAANRAREGEEFDKNAGPIKPAEDLAEDDDEDVEAAIEALSVRPDPASEPVAAAEVEALTAGFSAFGDGVEAGAAAKADEAEADDEGDLDDRDAEAEEAEADEPEIAGEPVFAIPRPEPQAEPEDEDEPEDEPADLPGDTGDREVVLRPEPSRQQRLFASAIDEGLISEAIQVVQESRRASASFLRRRLRIGYDEACDVLAELSARGVVDLDEDATQGRVRDE